MVLRANRKTKQIVRDEEEIRQVRRQLEQGATAAPERFAAYR